MNTITLITAYKANFSPLPISASGKKFNIEILSKQLPRPMFAVITVSEPSLIIY